MVIKFLTLTWKILATIVVCVWATGFVSAFLGVGEKSLSLNGEIIHDILMSSLLFTIGSILIVFVGLAVFMFFTAIYAIWTKD